MHYANSNIDYFFSFGWIYQLGELEAISFQFSQTLTLQLTIEARHKDLSF